MVEKERNFPVAPFDESSIRKEEISSSAFWRWFPAGMRRRWWLFRCFDLIARNWPQFRRPKGVLVVRMDGIGDMTLFRQSLDYYGEAFNVPREDIIVLGCRSWESISESIFAGYKVLTINEHAYAKNLVYRFIISLRVRCLCVSVAVCDSYFRRALMSDSLVWVSGAPTTIVSYPYINEETRSEFRYYLSQATQIIFTGDYPSHELVRHAQFVSAVLGRSIKPKLPSIDWPLAAQSSLTNADSYIVIVPDSNEIGRRWPLTYYKDLAKKFLSLGFEVLITGKNSEHDFLSGFSGEDQKKRIKDLSGRTSLPELLGLLKNAELVIANDTGSAHLSIALGAPTIVLVGGGHYLSFFPYPSTLRQAKIKFLCHKMSCYHCFWRCTKRNEQSDPFPCVELISLEAVWAASQKILQKAKS